MHGNSRRAFLSACGSAAVAQVTKPEPDRTGSLVRFGHTDLFVSRLCQGTAFRQVARDPNDSMGQKILHRALDLGINFFDSSNAYGWGGAELALGKAIAGRRDKLVIATKVSPHQKPEEAKPSVSVTLSRDFVMTQVEGSLRRLGTDYIDLYLYHNPHNQTPSGELVRTMDSLVRAGKIRYWGTSNFSPKQIGEFLDPGPHKGSAPMAGLEDLMEDELFPLIRRGRLGLMAFSPIAEGRLAPGREVDRSKPWAPVVDALDKVARELNATRPQVCVAWVLSHKEVTVVLAGVELPEHVDDNLAGTRPPDALASLNGASARLRGVDTSGR